MFERGSGRLLACESNGIHCIRQTFLCRHYLWIKVIVIKLIPTANTYWNLPYKFNQMNASVDIQYLANFWIHLLLFHSLKNRMEHCCAIWFVYFSWGFEPHSVSKLFDWDLFCFYVNICFTGFQCSTKLLLFICRAISAESAAEIRGTLVNTLLPIASEW